jgi:hypothetical protein
VRDLKLLRAADSATPSRGAAIIDMRTNQRIKRHPDEELRVELAEDFERFADALEGLAAVTHQGHDRCCVDSAAQLSGDTHDGALVRGERFEVGRGQVIDAGHDQAVLS